jgi:hypothetical protein
MELGKVPDRVMATARMQSNHHVCFAVLPFMFNAYLMPQSIQQIFPAYGCMKVAAFLYGGGGHDKCYFHFMGSDLNLLPTFKSYLSAS